MKHIGLVNVVTLSARFYMLSSSAPLAQEVLSQRAEQQLFNNACRTCHSIKEGDNYSPAMKDADFVWDEAKLARFIASPDEVVPGNKMTPYGGLASAEDRRNIVVFLLSMRTQ